MGKHSLDESPEWPVNDPDFQHSLHTEALAVLQTYFEVTAHPSLHAHWFFVFHLELDGATSPENPSWTALLKQRNVHNGEEIYEIRYKNKSANVLRHEQHSNRSVFWTRGL